MLGAVGHTLPIPTPTHPWGTFSPNLNRAPRPAHPATPHCLQRTSASPTCQTRPASPLAPNLPLESQGHCHGCHTAGQRASASSQAHLPHAAPCPGPLHSISMPPSWDCLIRSLGLSATPSWKLPGPHQAGKHTPSAALASQPEAHIVQPRLAEGRRDEPKGLSLGRGGVLCSKAITPHTHGP